MRVQQLKDTFNIIVRGNSRVLFSIFGQGGKRLKFGNYCISLHSLSLFSPHFFPFFSLAFFLCFALCWFLDISCLFLLFFPSLLSSLLFSFLSVIACVDSKEHDHSSVSGCVTIPYQSCRRPCVRPSVFVWRSHNGGWRVLSRNEERSFDKPEFVICLYGDVETKKVQFCCINFLKNPQTENHNTPVAQGKVTWDNVNEDFPLGSPRIVCSARNAIRCTGWHKLDCKHRFVCRSICWQTELIKYLRQHQMNTWLTNCIQQYTPLEAGSCSSG